MSSTSPKIFPAELAEFLALIVKGKPKSKSMERFHEFLRDCSRAWHNTPRALEERRSGESPAEFEQRRKEHQAREQENHRDLLKLGEDGVNERAEQYAASKIKHYEQAGIGKAEWDHLSNEYGVWWEERISETRRKSGVKSQLRRKNS